MLYPHCVVPSSLCVCLVCVQIEELGSEGRVEEAQGMMKLVEQLKEEREMISANPSVRSASHGVPRARHSLKC